MNTGLQKFLLATFGLFLSLGVLELAFRLLYRPQAPWSDRPKSYYFPQASNTFQDYKYSASKPTGTYRIAVVGDSFTFGPYLQFDDTFPKRLERLFGLSASYARVEVMNVGICGYSTRQEAALIKRLISEYHPDRILLQITLNDPEVQPYRVTHPPQVVSKSWLSRHSKLWDWIGQRLATSASRNDFKDYYFSLFENQETWKNFVQGISEIQQTTEQDKVQLSTVIFPLFSHPIDRKYPFYPLHEKIQHLLQEKNISFLDLTDYYAKIPPERLQVLPGRDSHPNEIAHRIAAEAIFTWLKRSQTLPQELFTPRKLRGRADQIFGKLPI